MLHFNRCLIVEWFLRLLTQVLQLRVFGGAFVLSRVDLTHVAQI